MIASLDDVRAALGTQSNIANVNLQRSFEAAQAWVQGRVYPHVWEDPETQEAVILGTLRLYRRPQSIEGVAGWNDIGVVRILASDPDVSALLEFKIDMTRAGLA